MPEYISKDVAFQRLLCKESEFNHWNDYNLAQYIIAQIVPEDVVPATHIQKLGNIVQTIKNGRACRTFSCCGTDCTELQRLPASYVFRLLRRVYKVSFRNCASR